MSETDGQSNQQDQSVEDQWSQALSESQPAQAPKEAAAPANFGALKQENLGSVANMDMILDIPVTVSVEIGRGRILIKELLQLGQGGVIELEKMAGEPMEILVNGKLIARGEAVVVNEKFGVKVTDIVSPSERISKLR